MRRRSGRQPGHDPRRQYRGSAQHLLCVVREWPRALLNPDGAGETWRTPGADARLMNADGQPWSQPQLRPLSNADYVVAGPQRVEDAPLADPLQMLSRTGATQDRQPPQLVGFVVGRRIGQHVGLLVFDADRKSPRLHS